MLKCVINLVKKNLYTVVIRFNPDKYTNNLGEKITSCWEPNKLGILTIVKKKEWDTRLTKLIDEIHYWINNPTKKTLEIIELFYN